MHCDEKRSNSFSDLSDHTRETLEHEHAIKAKVIEFKAKSMK